MSRRALFVAAAAGIAVAASGVRYAWAAEEARFAPSAGSAAVDGGGFSELPQRDTQIAVWKTALAADPTSALVLGQLAALHMQRAREGGGWSDYTQAESFARTSLARRTNRNGSTAATLVASLLAQHRFTEARDVITALVEREYDVPEYRAIAGEVAMELGDDATAESLFRSLWADRSSLSFAPRIARWLEVTNHVDDARTLLTKARDDAVSRRSVSNETKAWFHLRLGDLELRAGKPRRAASAYRAGLQIEPNDPRLHAGMARIAAARGRPRDAVAWGERALGMQLDPGTLGLVGAAYETLGDTTRANEYFQTLEVSIASQPGPFHRAWSLYLLDHNLRVAEVLARAESELRERKDVYGYDLVAWALHKSNRHAEARAMMAQALRLQTPDPLLRAHAAEIDRAAGTTVAVRP